MQPTDLRKSSAYYHWYHVVVNSAVMIVAPSAIMVYCSHSVYRNGGERAADKSIRKETLLSTFDNT